MATKLMINDLLDELNEENHRLIDELRYCQQLIELFDKYRHLVNSLQTNCVCIENNELKTQFNELDVQYLTLKSKKITTISADQIVDNHYKDDNNSKTRYQCYNNNTETVDTSAVSVVNEAIKRGRDKPKKSMVLSLTTKRNKQLKSNHPKGVYSCDYTGCDKQFKYMYLLKLHIQIKHNTSERRFKCDVDGCDQRFYRKDYLKAHHLTVHTNNSDGQLATNNCPYDGCAKEYKSLKALNRHISQRHTLLATKRFRCDVDGCDLGFYDKNRMEIHKQRVHYNVRLYPCEWPGCDKRFKSATDLKEHRERHSGVRQYRCDVGDECNKTFTTRKCLQQHKRSHTRPYQCSWPACEFRCANNINLEDHMNVHQGIKPFKCHFHGCDSSYSRRASLKVHWRLIHKFIK
ncbi:zinc finger protein 845-like, partial [Oppia nitens]|uniref:zinc finger protein 845-like n=1 Tax=Oppia nitens TaxID=1686743 RepID=UPI0023DB2348